MPTLNDSKHAALLVLTGETSGHIDDLEALWLSGLSTEFQTTYLDTSLLFDWLRDEGYTGTLNDMLFAWWSAGGGVATTFNVINGVDNVINGVDNVVATI